MSKRSNKLKMKWFSAQPGKIETTTETKNEPPSMSLKEFPSLSLKKGKSAPTIKPKSNSLKKNRNLSMTSIPSNSKRNLKMKIEAPILTYSKALVDRPAAVLATKKIEVPDTKPAEISVHKSRVSHLYRPSTMSENIQHPPVYPIVPSVETSGTRRSLKNNRRLSMTKIPSNSSRNLKMKVMSSSAI